MAELDVNVNVNTRGTEKLSGIGAGISKVGLNLTKFVTLPLLGVGAAALAAASEAEKSEARLENVFKHMKAAAFTSIPALNAQAAALDQLSTFDDEAITDAQATMLTFGRVTGDSFDQALQASVDLSSFMDQDLQSSVVQIGKALNDPIKGITALKRVGVTFTEQQQDQIAAMVAVNDTAGAQGIILAELQREFGGAAEAMANTNAGQAAQAFGDLQNAGEALGAIFLPVLSAFAKGLSTLAQFFLSLPAPMRGFIATFGIVLAAIGPAAFVIGKLIGAFRGVILVFNLLKVALLTNPFTALAIAVAAIAALIILNWDKIWAVLQAIWKKITDALGGLVRSFASAWGSIVSLTTAAWDSVANIIRGVINGVIGAINAFFGFLNGIVIGVPAIDVGPVHIGGGVIDPFNIGLIPQLASGGIIDSPTLALLGERGPEAVVPLDRGRLGSSTKVFNLEIQAPLRATDAQDIADYIDRVDRLAKAMEWTGA